MEIISVSIFDDNVDTTASSRTSTHPRDENTTNTEKRYESDNVASNSTNLYYNYLQDEWVE